MKELIARDLQHIWHPCSQMKDYELFKPLIIKSARGSYIELEDGRHLIDAISSWWCKSLGHGHPRLQKALLKQMERFEHVLLANTTHEVIVELSERLSNLSPRLRRVHYAADGSSAVEIAIKMSLHSRRLQGQPKRREFMSLSHAYHGETCTTLALSDVGIYREPYEALLPKTHFLRGLPYVSGEEDPLWKDCSEYWPTLEAQLNPLANTLSAILVEPIVQGAGGMLIYSPDCLKRLRAWTQAHDIHLIADEIMTGFGRTGLNLACEHAQIEPDFLCLSKGLTSGWLPLSATLTSDAMYALFYDDYERGKSFLHSHTHSGNALAAAVALECLKVIEEENILAEVQNNAPYLRSLMQEVADETKQLKNIRSLGAIVAADLIVDNPKERRGFAVYQKAVALGALLRPLGNTLYWLPPLNTDRETLRALQNITIQAIKTY